MMTIRPERETEFPALYDFTKTVFSTAKVKDGDEQDYVNKLRASEGYTPELCLVAEEDGAILGHIMLTRTRIVDGERTCETLLVAPLSVALECRSKGIGGKLMAAALDKARELGYTSAVLMGDPDYYNRFGYTRADGFGLRWCAEVPPQYFLAKELTPGGLNGVKGAVQDPV